MLEKTAELNILIFGSAVGSEHGKKRVKLRKEISKRFPSCDVRFSEDKDLMEATPASNPAEAELWHLAAADLCITLDTSQGVGEEIARFSSTNQAGKMLIFSNERFKGRNTFPNAVRAGLHVEYYSDKEYEKCSLVKRAIDRVCNLALEREVYGSG